MSYLVLARKWRPDFFEDVIGQDHVVRALVNSLNNQRLHHAWVFAGVRGVGKTSIARILAKSLNCEKGISSRPCNQCDSCKGIRSGGSLDYIELDAASNRGVEEMENLLSQANYTPVSGRFKIFLIDEVHMLTGHAFNSMLKTLEEPPEHVKFILATTDQHKIPMTVISRCLCFNLKHMENDSIVKQLSIILNSENILFDYESLKMIATLAKGSMRDALSITDQAVSYCKGKVNITEIREMFGIVDSAKVENLLRSIFSGDIKTIMNISREIIDLGFSYEYFLSSLATLLSNVAILQYLSPEDSKNMVENLDYQDIESFIYKVPSDLIQLLYTVIRHSYEELDKAPDHYSGFIMICLRLLSLSRDFKSGCSNIDAVKFQDNKYINDEHEVYDSDKYVDGSTVANKQHNDLIKKNVVHKIDRYELTSLSPDKWIKLVSHLPISGFVSELAKQSEFVDFDNNIIKIRVSIASLATKENKERLQLSLVDYFQVPVSLEILLGDIDGKTVYSIAQEEKNLKRKKIEQLVYDNQFVQDVIENLDGNLISESISELSEK